MLACGNPSRGDDALGPLLLARLSPWLQEAGLDGHFELIEDFQFQIEHALDLQGRQGALFIDAAEHLAESFQCHPLVADRVPSHSTHAISPAAVLDVFARVVDGEPPAAWLLALRGERFALGEGLSYTARQSLAAGEAFLRGFCSQLAGGSPGLMSLPRPLAAIGSDADSGYDSASRSSP